MKKVSMSALAWALIITFAVSLPLSAHAATAAKPAATPIPTTIPSIVQFFQNWTAEDIATAQTLATSIDGLQDPNGKACWGSFATLGALVKAHPLPATLRLASDIEAARLFAMSLKQVCTNPACSQVWLDAQNQISALAPINLPFSLTSICGKIP